MKIIEALKKIKDLQRKASDLRLKVRDHCTISSVETPMYGDDQKTTVSGWIQAHSDIVKEILYLRTAIQKTNLGTEVSVELNGKTVTKTIAEWIHRRRDLADTELAMWKQLTDKGIKEGVAQAPSGQEMKVTIVRFFDPKERDNRMEAYASEPTTIDARLEIVNAVTDILE